MGTGVSLFLITVGAILAFAVNVSSDGINLDTVGVILIILGLVGLLASLVFWEDWMPRRRAVGYDDDRDVVVRHSRIVDIEDDGVVDVVDERPVIDARRVDDRSVVDADPVVERRRVTTRRSYDDF